MKYIKYSCVVFIQSNEKSVCAICIPDLISTSLNWEYLDTDEDGIPDIYEKEFGTDPNKTDTDDDGLTDYEEIYLTDTDPLVYNSFNENLSDSDADSDSDGITNRKEIDIGTNPLNPDTDGDGVSDGEELKIGTDPLKYDTDGDGIGDGDELILGLDPTSETTDGIKDCERMTVQEIAEDSDVMSEINTEENPMKVSIEFEAAGLAESSLDVSESGYSSAMNNSAIVGSTPEFSYPEGLAVGDVTIKFNVSDSVKSNTVGDYAENCEELKGIKRFNVFRYFEEINMLLPIETFHDEEQGVVYTKTDCLGTYCVMDLEIWMQNLGVEPELETDEDSTQVSAQYLNAEAETETVKENEKLNVVFFLDTRKSVDYEEFSDMKNIVNDTLKIIIDNTVSSENPERILNINDPILCTQLSDEKLKYYSITSDSEIEKVVSGIKQETKSSDSEAIFDITSALGLLMDEYDDSETVLFIVTSKEKIMARSDMSKKIYRHLQHSENIHVSFVSRDMKPATNSYVENIAKASDGKIFADFDVEEIKNYIWSYSDVAANNYKIITANNYETIMLDSVLRKNSGTDTDKDKLSDWQEINTELIERLKPGAADKGYLTMDDMPTISDIIIAIGRNDGTLEINESSSALKNFIKKYGATPYHALLSPVTPIKSNPIDADSDNDGVIDSSDTVKLDGSNRTPKDITDDYLEFGIAQKYDSKIFRIKMSEDYISQNGDKVNLYSTPFYDSEQYSDVVLFNNSLINANYLVISRGLQEDCDKNDSEKKYRRIKYWMKVKINNKIGYLPCDLIDFSEYNGINGYIECLNSIMSTDKDGFYSWYIPLQDSIGIYRPIPRFVQTEWGPCAVLSMMMVTYNLNGSDLSPWQYYKTNYIKNINAFHRGDNYTYWYNSPCELIDSNFRPEPTINDDVIDVDVIKEYLYKNIPIILGGNDTPVKDQTETKGINHYCVIVSYVDNCNNDEDDDIIYVIDPFISSSFPSSIDEFVSRYKYGPRQKENHRMVIYTRKGDLYLYY